MKKLVYGGLFLALVGIGFVGCKKEHRNLEKSTELNLDNQEVLSVLKSSMGDIEIREGVIVFSSWNDVGSLIERLENAVDENISNFEFNHSKTLNDLVILNSNTTNLDDGPSWEAENAIDSFEMVQSWNEYQPLIDFETSYNFYSLRAKFDFELYGNEDNELTSDQRDYYNTFPLEDEFAALFNHQGIIGVGDSVYKVLHNNVWLSCLFEHKDDLIGLTEGNYESLIDLNRIVVLNKSEKSKTCYSNVKRTDSKRGGSNNKYRVYGVLTVTNVGVINGRFIKGITKSERQNNRGKWKRRRTLCQVSGSAQMMWGNRCDIPFQRIINGTFNESHSNRSSRTGRYRSESIFRVKNNEFFTYHRVGIGSNKLEITINLE